MLALLLKRILAALLTLWVVASLTFVLMRLLPGGPFDRERKVPEAVQRNLEAQYHLNDPLPVQYGYYLKALLAGDLGPSYQYPSRRVQDILAEALGASLKIGFWALIVGTLAGIALGTLAGFTHNRWLDGGLSLLGVSSLSTPAFIWAGGLVLVFALWLNGLPAATLQTPVHYILPVVALSLTPFAYAFLLVRTQVRETRRLGFVRVKRSFGVSEGRVMVRHVLRHSLIPLVSVLGPMSAAIITGSFAVEYIFAIPGLGKHFISAVTNRDYTLVMGVTLLYSAVLLTFNAATDCLYGVLDPRMREGS